MDYPLTAIEKIVADLRTLEDRAVKVVVRKWDDALIDRETALETMGESINNEDRAYWNNVAIHRRNDALSLIAVLRELHREFFPQHYHPV